MKIATAAAAVIGLTMAAVGTANAAGIHGTGGVTNSAIANGTATTTNGLGFGNGTTGVVTTTPTTTTTGTGNNIGATTGFGGNAGLGTGSAQVGARAFDQQFLRKATIDSQQEILLGSVAQTNSDNAAIQSFGQTLVQDHTAAITEAQNVAASLGITLPDTSGTLSGVPPRLLTATGVQFDRQFIAFMIQSHMQDINLFEMAALRGRSADVRAFARDQLPVLMQHLVTALGIREDLISTTTTGAGTATGTGTTTGTGADPAPRTSTGR